MADVVELVPVNERDEAIFRAWESGKGPQGLAREFSIPVAEVERALDRCLPAFDAQNQLRAFKRELRRLEDLSNEFFTIAKRDKDRDCAHLVARLNERVAAMRGWSAINIRMDPMTTQATQQPSSHDKIKAAIFGLIDRLPPEQQALRRRLAELSPTQALELLGLPKPIDGNGAADGR